MDIDSLNNGNIYLSVVTKDCSSTSDNSSIIPVFAVEYLLCRWNSIHLDCYVGLTGYVVVKDLLLELEDEVDSAVG